MNRTGRELCAGLRITCAIAAKDIVDALKNKTILTNVVIVFAMMVICQLLAPLMYEVDPDVVVYDPAGSRLTAMIEDSPQFALHRASSIDDLKEQMAGSPRGDLGLVVPDDFDQRLASAASGSGDGPELGGVVIWSSRTKATELKSDYERRLAQLMGQPVRISIEGNVYPAPDSMGPIRMVAVTLVLVTLMMTWFTVPHLMFEEKQNRTVDALLISPASISHVVIGKALAGLFYCTTVVIVTFAFNWAFVVHWGPTLVAVLSGMLLAVALALALGVFFDNRQQMMIWSLIPAQILLGPVFLSAVDPILPAALRDAMYWIPTVSLALVFRYAFSDGGTWLQILPYLSVVLTTAFGIFVLIVWRVRQSDR